MGQLKITISPWSAHLADILIASVSLSLFLIPSVIRSFYDILYDSGARTEEYSDALLNHYDSLWRSCMFARFYLLGYLSRAISSFEHSKRGNPFDARNFAFVLRSSGSSHYC